MSLTHFVHSPSCGCTFYMLLGADGTSLDAVRISLGIARSPMSPQPLPTPSHLSGLSLSLSRFHPSPLGGGQRSDTWYSRSTRQCGPPILRTAPLHKPSLATEHTIANIYQVVRKNGLSLHACASTCTFISFPCFCLFFEVSLPLGRNRKNTRDLDSCFLATTWQLGLLKHWKRLRATAPNPSPVIFARGHLYMYTI